jgi:predicted enzyme related to lactoylglutathione lyase
MRCNGRAASVARLNELVGRHSLGLDMQLIVNIDVDDLEKAIAFYSDGLGLRLARRLFDDSVAEMSGASSAIQLLLKPAGSSPASSVPVTRRYRRHWTPVHLDFAVEDISAGVERATRAGATLEGTVQSHAWGHLATLSDPFGHGFCLLQFVGRGYDQVA